MCDEIVRPQTVTGGTVKYTENAPAPAASVQQAESLLLEALGKCFTENLTNSDRGLRGARLLVTVYMVQQCNADSY